MATVPDSSGNTKLDVTLVEPAATAAFDPFATLTDVTDYGAVADAIEFIGLTTVAGGTPTQITLKSFVGNITGVVVSTYVTQITIAQVASTTFNFKHSHVGRNVWLSVGALTLSAVITKYIAEDIIEITSTALASTIATASGTLLVDAPQATDVGKAIVIDGVGQVNWWSGNYTVRQILTQLPYGTTNLIRTISAVSGNVITVNSAIPYTYTDVVTRIQWGTDNAVACGNAAIAAAAAGNRGLSFPKGVGNYLLVGVLSGGASRQAYVTALDDAKANTLVNGMLWITDRAFVWAYDTGGRLLEKTASRYDDVLYMQNDGMISGSQAFARCNQLTTIDVLFSGDSMSIVSGQDQGTAWQHVDTLRYYLRKHNPKKVLNTYAVGVGGYTYASIASSTSTISNASTPVGHWIVPRPISGTVQYINFLLDVNRTGGGGAILPDLLVLFITGFNDSWNLDVDSLLQIINRVRAISHGDAFGPTDIILATDRIGTMPTYNNGASGGIVLPNALTKYSGSAYAAQLIRTFADYAGYPCIDLFPLGSRITNGVDQRRGTFFNVPAQSGVASAAAPMVLNTACRNFTMRIGFTAGGNFNTNWTSMGSLDVALSSHPGNRLMLRRDSVGKLWMGVSTYGETVTTTTTTTSGLATLTVAAPASYAAQTITCRVDIPMLYAASAPFVAGDVGKCIIAPIGHGNIQQRTYIMAQLDTSNVWLQDRMAYTTDTNSLAGQTFTIGGQHFKATDADSKPHVTIFYAASIFTSTVSAYTSATQVTLANNAPTTVAASALPVFVGHLSVPWFDTGIDLTTETTSTAIQITVQNGELTLGIVRSTGVAYLPIQKPIVRFGADFYPRIIPGASTNITLSNVWLDNRTTYAQQLTTWEARGITGDGGYEYGGDGVHSSSAVLANVLQPFYDANRLNFT